MKSHFKAAGRALFKMRETDDAGVVLRALAEILKYAEYIIYMANKTYVKGGVKRIPSEIAGMKNLPEGFLDIYNKIVTVSDIFEIKNESEKMMKVLSEFLDCEVEFVPVETKEKCQKKEPGLESLTGTYEEIYSNWYNKMLHAKEIDSKYLSFNTMASCQEFYDEMSDEYNVPLISLIDKYDPDDLDVNARNFELAMSEWKKNYDKLGILVREFKNLDEFEAAYL